MPRHQQRLRQPDPRLDLLAQIDQLDRAEILLGALSTAHRLTESTSRLSPNWTQFQIVESAYNCGTIKPTVREAMFNLRRLAVETGSLTRLEYSTDLDAGNKNGVILRVILLK